MRYIQKTENDFITLLRKCEPLDMGHIDELLSLAEKTSFEQVQLYLLERKEEYIKCLQMLLREAEKKRFANSSNWKQSVALRETTFLSELIRLPIAS